MLVGHDLWFTLLDSTLIDRTVVALLDGGMND